MKILTSMNREIYDAYGADSLERFIRFLPPNMGNHEKVEIVVYWNGYNKPHLQNVEFRSLENIKGFCEFRIYADAHQAKLQVHKRQNAFLWNARRFACKAFAWGDYLPDDDVIWLDADVKIFDHVPVGFLRSLITERAYTYLGRDSYTETGFLAFNHRHPESYWLRREIIEQYRNREIFALEHWTDCHVFDEAKRCMGLSKGNNLSPDGKAFDHVFNDSILGRYMDHCKGPRKNLGYSPEYHKSVAERDHGVRAASG